MEKINSQNRNTPVSLESESDCPVCFGGRFIHPLLPSGKPDYGHLKPCKCSEEKFKKERMQRLVQYCELPPGAENMTFENYKVRPELKEAYGIAKMVASTPNNSAWVVFQGSNDTGKTHLCIAICREWLAQGVAAQYSFVPLLLDELREGFKKEGDFSYEARYNHFKNVPLLLLDDLGAESTTSWVSEKLETIVDYRLMNNLSLLVTTNKTFDELSARLRSRLVRHPKTQLVLMQAEEYTLYRTRGQK